MKSYKYIGPQELLELTKTVGKGVKITSPEDVLSWIKQSNQKPVDDRVIATFIVDLYGNLLIADRQSEHVACAGGEKVLSAGEMTFLLEGSAVTVEEETNQSTGYCPQPESWASVKTSLAKAHLDAPDRFGREFIFRKCENCGLVNIVKEDWYVCAQCNTDLNPLWNIDEGASDEK